MIMYSSVIGMVPVNIMQPNYECQSKESEDKYPCKPVDFCSDPSINYSIDWTASTSLHNYIETFDLTCARPTDIGLIGSCFFTGMTISIFFVTRLADIYGRKIVQLTGACIILPMIIWMLNTKSLF